MTTYIHEPPLYKEIVKPIETDHEYFVWTGHTFGDLDLVKEGWSFETRGKIKYPVITLCGSTRFWQTFTEQNLRLTLEGNIVLSVGAATASDEEHGITPEQKIALDALHKAKIDMSDKILVLNVGGYIGESTRSEINHAIERGIPVEYLEEDSGH